MRAAPKFAPVTLSTSYTRNASAARARAPARRTDDALGGGGSRGRPVAVPARVLLSQGSLRARAARPCRARLRQGHGLVRAGVRGRARRRAPGGAHLAGAGRPVRAPVRGLRARRVRGGGGEILRVPRADLLVERV